MVERGEEAEREREPSIADRRRRPRGSSGKKKASLSPGRWIDSPPISARTVGTVTVRGPRRVVLFLLAAVMMMMMMMVAALVHKQHKPVPLPLMSHQPTANLFISGVEAVRPFIFRGACVGVCVRACACFHCSASSHVYFILPIFCCALSSR